MLLLLLTAKLAAGRDLYVQLYSHTQVSGTLHIWASNLVLFKIKGFWKILPQNPKMFRNQMEGLFIGPSIKFQRTLHNHFESQKVKLWASLGTYFSVCSYLKFLSV